MGPRIGSENIIPGFALARLDQAISQIALSDAASTAPSRKAPCQYCNFDPSGIGQQA
jgi:hypothetical protein